MNEIHRLSEQRLRLDPRLELRHLDDGDADALGEPLKVEDGVEGDGGWDVCVVVDVAEVEGGREREDDGYPTREKGKMNGCRNGRGRWSAVRLRRWRFWRDERSLSAPLAPIITSFAEEARKDKKEGGSG